MSPTDKELAKLQKLTPADFANTVTVQDDDLEPIATISTERGYTSKGRFTDRVRSDNFLRAFVSKSTGTVRYQLYQSIFYSSDWRWFKIVNYATPDGPRTADLIDINSETVTCSYGICARREAVGFTVGEELLQKIASTYVAGLPPLWRFRFKAKSGLDWEDHMSPAEVAGLLQAVRAYRGRAGTPK